MGYTYRKLLNELKGTDAYNAALQMPHRARTARNIEKSRQGVLLFGKKGNDFVFKIGSKSIAPAMISSEEALSLFAAEREEEPVDLSKDFDNVYQKVKSALFSSDVKDRNEKDILNAVSKIKVFQKNKLLSADYLFDLISVVKADALSGFEIRFINQLALKDATKLPQKITAEYLARIILTQNRVDDSEETLILSEELQK